MLVNSESTTALQVTIAASPTPSVSKYRASSGGYVCEVEASTSPLTCTLSGLPAGEMYVVAVVACLENGVCSESVERTGYTLPEGRFPKPSWKCIEASYKRMTVYFSSVKCFN